MDRIDLDWEFISPSGQNYGLSTNSVHPNDAQNFGLLLQLFKECLINQNLGYIQLSACTASQPERIKALPIQAMAQYLDSINVMTYDFSSSEWGPTLAGHQSNILNAKPYTNNSVDDAVQTFLSLGVPTSKLVIGVPFYSRGFYSSF